MKKVLKFTAIGLVIFAIVANLHSAVFSFYGFKTNNLEGAAWAQGTSGGGGGIGCYNPYTLSCRTVILGITYYDGEERRCDFSGSYGAPYRCEQISCTGTISQRECVQPSTSQ